MLVPRVLVRAVRTDGHAGAVVAAIDAAVAFARIGYEGSGSLVIAAFTPKDQIRRHLETLATAGLDPKIVTLGTHALAGFLARARNGTGGSHLVLAFACAKSIPSSSIESSRRRAESSGGWRKPTT